MYSFITYQHLAQTTYIFRMFWNQSPLSTAKTKIQKNQNYRDLEHKFIQVFHQINIFGSLHVCLIAFILERYNLTKWLGARNECGKQKKILLTSIILKNFYFEYYSYRLGFIMKCLRNVHRAFSIIQKNCQGRESNFISSTISATNHHRSRITKQIIANSCTPFETTLWDYYTIFHED